MGSGGTPKVQRGARRHASVSTSSPFKAKKPAERPCKAPNDKLPPCPDLAAAINGWITKYPAMVQTRVPKTINTFVLITETGAWLGSLFVDLRTKVSRITAAAKLT